MDAKAQMHVLEVLLTAVLFTSAMNVSVAVLPSPSIDPAAGLQLEILGQDALNVADGLVPANSTLAARYHNSTMKYWLFDDRLGELGAYLNTTLPSTVAFRVELGPDGEAPTAWLNWSRLPGQVDVVIIGRLLFHDGQFYQIDLWLWYGSRGGGI